jgi:iron-sulfur cluster assembly protein
MINITDNAAKAIVGTMQEEGRDPGRQYMRVAVQGGGCSGLSYKLEFSDQLSEGDEVFAHEATGIKVAVDKKSMLFLHGLTLDFTSGLNGKGFVFDNPNATGTCGCGTSFKV